MLCVYGYSNFFNSPSVGIEFRHQNLTSKVAPHIERVKVLSGQSFNLKPPQMGANFSVVWFETNHLLLELIEQKNGIWDDKYVLKTIIVVLSA